eukprot:3381674-Pyramimonas_sp.AAC.1
MLASARHRLRVAARKVPTQSRISIIHMFAIPHLLRSDSALAELASFGDRFKLGFGDFFLDTVISIAYILMWIAVTTSAKMKCRLQAELFGWPLGGCAQFVVPSENAESMWRRALHDSDAYLCRHSACAAFSTSANTPYKWYKPLIMYPR